MYHSESSLIPLVLKACQSKGGSATFEEQREYIKPRMALTEEDEEEYPSAPMQRWTQIHRNLKSNKTLVKKGLVKEIKDGFSLTRKGKALAKIL